MSHASTVYGKKYSNDDNLPKSLNCHGSMENRVMGKWKLKSNPYLDLHRKFLTRLGGQLGDEQLTTSRSCWIPSRVQLPSDVPRQNIKDIISDLSWLSWFMTQCMKIPIQRPLWERKWERNLILEENTIILIFASLETNEKNNNCLTCALIPVWH